MLMGFSVTQNPEYHTNHLIPRYFITNFPIKKQKTSDKECQLSKKKKPSTFLCFSNHILIALNAMLYDTYEEHNIVETELC